MRAAFKHFPLESHTQARLAAQAAVAAGRQGHFFEMASLIFENQNALTEEDLVAYARRLGLDVARFEADLDSEEVRQKVVADRAEGERLGVEGTPTFFVDGRRVNDDTEHLGEWVDDALAR